MTTRKEPPPDAPAGQSAADVLSALGPWAGETTEEILALLANARRSSLKWREQIEQGCFKHSETS